MCCWNAGCSSTTRSTRGAPARSRHRYDRRAAGPAGHRARRGTPGRHLDGRSGDHRPQIGRAAVPRRQARLLRDRDRRRPGHPRRTCRLAARARGRERREAIWFRDAEVAEAVEAILFIGLAPNWYPPNYDCGACGYATCAEFLHASKELRKESDELEFTGPTCNLRDIDLGIAVGSAAKTAAINSIDCRCQTRVAVAARKLGHITAEIAVALSVTHKAIGFDRRMPEIDFDALDLPGTGTLPVGIAGAVRSGGARNRQQPRRPTVRR
jgi:uncharacterized ferredoxin-like protein